MIYRKVTCSDRLPKVGQRVSFDDTWFIVEAITDTINSGYIIVTASGFLKPDTCYFEEEVTLPSEKSDILNLIKCSETVLAENEKLTELIKSFEQPLHLLGQLVLGWKSTTPTQEWSEFDEESYQGLVKMQTKIKETIIMEDSDLRIERGEDGWG